MFEEIKKSYGEFHDALITEVNYRTDFNYHNYQDSGVNEVEVFISCFNLIKKFQRELIKITFVDVSVFKFGAYEGMVNLALLKKENDLITFDFYPIIYSDYLEEDLNSDCIIKCKKVFYSVVE